MLQKCNFNLLLRLKSVSGNALGIETVNWRLEFHQSSNLNLNPICPDSLYSNL